MLKKTWLVQYVFTIKTVTYLFNKTFIFFLLTILAACETTIDSFTSTTNNPSNQYKEKVAQITLQFDDRLLIYKNKTQLAFEIRDFDTNQLISSQWVNYNDNQQVIVSNLPHGRYQITTFIEKQTIYNPTDDSVLPTYQGCSTPFNIRDPLDTQQVDHSVATWEGILQQDIMVPMILRDLSCGPGSPSTTLIGLIEAPNQPLPPLFMQLTPSTDTLDEFYTKITFPLNLYPLQDKLNDTSSLLFNFEDFDLEQLQKDAQDQDQTLYVFVLSQIAQGEYTTRIFSDEDKDARPTVCNIDQRLGWDHWQSNALLTNVIRGETNKQTKLFKLVYETDCDLLIQQEEPLVPMTAQIQYQESLLDHLYRNQTQLWFSYQTRKNEPQHYISGQKLMNISDLLLSDGRFTLLVPQQKLDHSLALWVERGGDQKMIPCTELQGWGSETFWWEGLVNDLTSLNGTSQNEAQDVTMETLRSINILPRCEDQYSLLQGSFILEENHLTHWKDRPVYLVVEDLFSEKVTTMLLNDLTIDHIGRTLSFERRIAPGSYRVYVYIDQDLNQNYNPCGRSQLGDQWISNDEIISIPDQNTVQQVDFDLNRNFCEANESHIVIELPQVEDVIVDRLGICQNQEYLIHIEEFKSDFTLQTCHSPSESHTLVSELLSIGTYQMSLCIGIDTTWTQVESLLGLQESYSNDACDTPQYLVGESTVHLTQYPQQQATVLLYPSCSCLHLESL